MRRVSGGAVTTSTTWAERNRPGRIRDDNWGRWMNHSGQRGVRSKISNISSLTLITVEIAQKNGALISIYSEKGPRNAAFYFVAWQFSGLI